MKKINIIFLCIYTIMSCSKPTSYYSYFKEPEELNKTTIIPTDSLYTKVITINKPIDIINSSEIIEEISYIPLETTSESLISFFRNVFFYENKIFILDDLGSEALFIYDINGNFLKKIGTKGQGPEEFNILRGMCLDKKNGYIILYDNGKGKMMYYDTYGNFIKKTDVKYLQSSQFGILPSNLIVSVTSNSDANFHLKDYNQYRLIFSDTIGNIQKFGFKFDDNINLFFGWSKLFFDNNEMLFYQQFTNSIYCISDSMISEKYRIDCSNFTPFDINKISSFKNNDEIDEYWYQKTNLAPYMAENNSHLYFVVNNKKENYKYFYDKRTGNHIGFKKINYDTDFFETFQSNIFSHDDYFIGRASASDLLKLKKDRDSSGVPLSVKINKMIESLNEEDNDVLILFKIKEL